MILIKAIILFIMISLIPITHLYAQPSDMRFEHLPNDSNSLSNNLVEMIFEDHPGVLWIGTADGLNKAVPLDGKKLKFTCYRHNPADPGSLSGNHVRSIYEDHTGTLWIGTWDNGVSRFDGKASKFRLYRHEPIFTGKAKGIGLGMAISKTFVDGHGGTAVSTYKVKPEKAPPLLSSCLA